LSAYTEVSAAVHDQPSEDVDDQVPPLQAYRDQTSTVVPFHISTCKQWRTARYLTRWWWGGTLLSRFSTLRASFGSFPISPQCWRLT